MTRLHLAALVGTLVVLAGCAGLAGDATRPVEDTVTPAPVPDSETSAAIAPGVTSERVEASVVADRHDRALSGSSFTLRSYLRTRWPDGTTERRTTVRRVAADGERFVVERRYSPPRGVSNRSSGGVWATDDRTVIRTTYRDGSETFLTTSEGSATDPTNARTVAAVLDGLTVRQTNRTGDGALIVAGALSSAADLPAPRARSHPTRATATVRVSPDGYVDRLAVEYDAALRGEQVHVRYAMHVTAVGETTVSRPPWVDRARDGPGIVTGER